MSWFKDFFIRKDSQAQSIPTPIKRKPDISEPVISFVETFKANPQRFKINKQGPLIREGSWDLVLYTLVDKKANLSWPFSFRFYNQPMRTSCRVHASPSFPDFLTDDEFTYIEDNLREFFYKRAQRLSKIREKRKNYRSAKQREALKKVYCK